LSLLHGCASLSESECRSGDWYEIGLQDALGGYGRDRLSTHREACREYRILPNAAAYDQGYAAGLERFCTPQRGYEFGRRGGGYNHICPPSLEAGFLFNYQMGRAIYDAVQRIEQIEREIDAQENQLRKITLRTSERGREIRRELRRLDEERDALRWKLEQMELQMWRWR